MRTNRTLLAATLAATAAVAGCSSGPSAPSPHGPLVGAAPGGSDCSPSRPGAGFTFGIEVFKNAGHSTLTLDSLALRDPRGLRLIGAYADPGQYLVGAMPGWPPHPPAGIALPPTWGGRKPMSGFRLAPGKWFGLVIGVTAPHPPGGSTSGLVIRYHDSAGSYIVQDHFGYSVVTRSSC